MNSKKYQTIYAKPRRIKDVLGMELDEWRYKSCLAHVGTGKDWATLYLIESQQEGKGHATELLLIMKNYYEHQGKRFGGSVALNERMARLYKKYGVYEYASSDVEL